MHALSMFSYSPIIILFYYKEILYLLRHVKFVQKEAPEYMKCFRNVTKSII